MSKTQKILKMLAKGDSVASIAKTLGVTLAEVKLEKKAWLNEGSPWNDMLVASGDRKPAKAKPATWNGPLSPAEMRQWEAFLPKASNLQIFLMQDAITENLKNRL